MIAIGFWDLLDGHPILCQATLLYSGTPKNCFLLMVPALMNELEN